MKPLIGLAFLFLAGCQGAAEEAQAPVTLHQVQGLELQLQPGYQVPRRILGKISAVQAGDVGFELAGKVSKVHKFEGDSFKQGDVLAELDTQLLEIERQQLRAQVSEVQAQLKLSQATQERLRSLKQSGFTSSQSIDEIASERAALEARKIRLQAQLEFNRIQLQKSTLRAPFDGKVERRMITRGVVLGSGQAAMRLVANQTSQAKFGVPSEMVAHFNQEQAYSIEVAGGQYPARLLGTGAQVNTNSRTVQLRFELVSETPMLDGQIAYLITSVDYDNPGYWVPLTALTDGLRGRWNLYVLSPSEQDQEYLLERRDVTILYTDDARAYVEGALAPGERVLATGLHRVVPGQRVRLHPELAQVELETQL